MHVEKAANDNEPMPLDVIGLMGALGCGKTTVAKHLEQTRGYLRVRMADALKAMLLTLGLSKDEVDGDRKEVPSALLGGKTPRFAMQTLGTEWGRQMISMDLWVGATEAKIRRIANNDVVPVGIVIDDIRFPNEVAMVQRLCGRLAVVRRPSVEPGPFAPMHASEAYWKRMAALHEVPKITNCGDLPALVAAADAVLFPIPLTSTQR